jgi:hypothetical protein
MKRTLVTGAALAMVLAGCTSNPDEVPTPVPAPSVSAPSATPSPQPSVEEGTGEAPGGPVDERTWEPTREPTKQPEKPVESPSASQLPAEPPATLFIKRWRADYPMVDEPSVLGAAKDACLRAQNAGEGWELNADVQNDVTNYMISAGFPDVRGGTATAFTKDALASVC